eukprot:UN04255
MTYTILTIGSIAVPYNKKVICVLISPLLYVLRYNNLLSFSVYCCHCCECLFTINIAINCVLKIINCCHFAFSTTTKTCFHWLRSR